MVFTFIRRRHQKFFPSLNRGFSLIELVAVTGVLVLVTGVVLAGNSRFGGVLTLRALAYDVALTLREAQTYGISVRRFGVGNFQSPYGIHFERNSPTIYSLFADLPPENGTFDLDAFSNEEVKYIEIGRGFAISDLCYRPIGASEEICGTPNLKLDVLFRRPEPDAEIRINGGSQLNESARIVLQSPRGDIASVIVEATGQISVEDTKTYDTLP